MFSCEQALRGGVGVAVTRAPYHGMNVRITGGTHRGRRLRSPGGTGLRPTTEKVRGAVFSILGRDVVHGARVLDLFAGTGVMGIEALSRGAEQADFVEVDALRAKSIREGLSGLSMDERGRVYRMRVERALVSLSGVYDLVFVDPPYDLEDWDALMDGIAASGLTEAEGEVVVEYSSRTSLATRYGGLVEDTRRRYGDTSITIYRVEPVDG